MSIPMTDEALRQVVRQAIDDVLKEQGTVTARPGGSREASAVRRAAPRRPLPPPLSPAAIDRIQRASPSRLAQGRAGTRYLTEVYVGLRADHAIALDAVHSELPEEFAAAHGLLPLHSQCESHDEFLLYPERGRRLDDASRQRLAAEGDKGVDIQIIAGDGLSAYALVQNGPPLLAALSSQLPAAGFRVGKPLLVSLARVGVQDEIGVMTEAKATLIIVGERPGLGTGDSLSIYTAFGPKLGQDNSEKDCISNIRKLGLAPEEAARRCVDLWRRTFAAGGGGVRLV
jgi:ethanolamine ammonia-lyase small subunit